MKEKYEALIEAKRNIEIKQKKDDEREQQRFKEVTYEVGDLVWKRTHSWTDRDKDRTRKFMPKYKGPWVIESRVRERSLYEIRRAESTERAIVHVAELREYVHRPEWMCRYIPRNYYEVVKSRAMADEGESSEESE